MTKATSLQVTAWLLGVAVVVVSVGVWIEVRFHKPLSAYDIMPVLGLVAYGLMWTHYVVGALRIRLNQDPLVLKRYFTLTSALVLLLLLLHPGIFLVKLWLDGFGLPPFSYLKLYTMFVPRIMLLLGSISLLVFLAFEFHRKYGHRSWWKYIDYANMAAMVVIFFHALTLGGELQVLWFQLLWWFYGITLGLAILYNVMYLNGRDA